MRFKFLMNLRRRIMREILGYTWFEEEGRKPHGRLDVLIQRCEDRKRQYHGLPKCPYCGTQMMFRHSALAGGSGAPIRDDQGWKCVACFHTAHFGIPLTRDEYEDEYQLRGGRFLTRPTYRLDERGRDEVMKRLRALGYLDFSNVSQTKK